MSYFARSAFNDCVAEHSDDHDEQEVASVHQVQVDQRAVVLQRGERRRGLLEKACASQVSAGDHQFYRASVVEVEPLRRVKMVLRLQ